MIKINASCKSYARRNRYEAKKTKQMNNASHSISILHENQHWMAVHKPAGIFTHPTDLDRRAPDLLTRLEQQSGQKLNALTRLDRATSGALILTKTGLATQKLQEQWHLPQTQKSYLCLVRGTTTDNFYSDRPLSDLRTKIKKTARTDFMKIENYHRSTLVSAQIRQGRTHQIRRHLAHLGHHIIGDTTYGKGGINRWARELGLSRMFLHCHQLDFYDPFSERMVKIHSPLAPELELFLKNISLNSILDLPLS